MDTRTTGPRTALVLVKRPEQALGKHGIRDVYRPQALDELLLVHCPGDDLARVQLLLLVVIIVARFFLPSAAPSIRLRDVVCSEEMLCVLILDSSDDRLPVTAGFHRLHKLGLQAENRVKAVRELHIDVDDVSPQIGGQVAVVDHSPQAPHQLVRPPHLAQSEPGGSVRWYCRQLLHPVQERRTKRTDSAGLVWSPA